ncbi:MAG: iron ABC transporter permease [Planctomycetes bacterium]|nr:iron ABC transporter permease [Planctomycetota bacterium]
MDGTGEISQRQDRSAGGDFLDGFLTSSAVILWGILLLPLAFLASELFPHLGSLVKIDTRIFYAENTLIICATTAATALMIGIPFGFILGRTTFPGKTFGWLIVAIMAFTPLYVSTTAWISLIGSMAETLGLSQTGTPTGLPVLVAASRTAQLAVCGIIMGVAYSPMAILLCAAGFASVPEELEDAARLNAGSTATFLRVTLPLSLWSIGASLCLVCFLAANEITVTDAIWVRSYAEQIYRSFQGTPEIGEAALPALPLMLATVIGFAILIPAINRLTDKPLDMTSSRARKISLGKYGAVALIACLALGVFYISPMGHLSAYALQSARQPDKPVVAVQSVLRASKIKEISRPWYQRLGITGTSALLAAAGASMAIIAAMPCAWFLCRTRRRIARYFIWAITVISIACPPPLAGIAFVGTWNSGAWSKAAGALHLPALARIPDLVYDSPLIVVFFYAFKTAPIAMIIIWASIRHIPENIIDMAKLDGLGPWGMIRSIAIPLCKRGIACAWIVGYILSISEVAGIILTSPPGLPLFQRHFAVQIHFGVYPDLARLAIIPFLGAIIPAIVILLIFRPKDKPRAKTVPS